MKRQLAALLRRDVRGIYRDRFLVSMAAYTLVIAVAMRVLIRVIPVPRIELYAAPFVILIACSLIGLVFGFGLIEERETKTWLLLRVVPIDPATLTTYWVGTVSGFCLLLSLLSAWIYGLAPANPGAFLVFTAITALGAPIVMLLLGALAANKIQGLAVGKIISGSSLLLVGIFALPGRWQFTLMWYPWYWIYLGLLRAYAGSEQAASLAVTWPAAPAWLYAVLPLAISALLIWGLMRRYGNTQV